MGADAKVTVDADASAVDRVFGEMKSGARSTASEMMASLGNAAKSVALSLGDIALSAGKVNFSAQHSQVQAFEAATAKMAVAAGRDLESVRTEFTQIGASIGKPRSEVIAWASSVGRLTYSFDDAAKSMKGMSQLAAATGRNVEDYRGLAVELHNVGAVAGDTTNVIGVMTAQAEKFGNAGGIAAFADQIEGLGGTISMFAINSQKDFTKVTALAGELGKGLSPQAAQRVQQTAFASIASDPLRWERYLGKGITDSKGHVGVDEKTGEGMDPSEVMRQITEKTKKRYGADARRVMMLNFGAEAGSAMYSANYSEAAKAAGLGPSGTPAQKQAAYLQTDAGKREQATGQLEKSAGDLLKSSSMLGKAADAMQRFAASNPLTSTVVAGALSAGASTGLGALGKALMGGKGAASLGAAGGGLAMAGAGLAAAGSLAYAYHEISGTADELYGKNGKGGSFTGDLKEWAGGKTAVSKGNAGFAAMQEENAKNLALAKAKAGGESPSTKEISQAVKDGLKDAKIVNMTSPVEVAAQSSQSVSSGNQSE